jgi:N-acetylglucosaminyldiphosphoundecaprenol N-acetyl-beta-D-mannosaminyltransferase
MAATSSHDSGDAVAAAQTAKYPAWFNLLGVKVAVVDLACVAAIVESWIDARRASYVCVRDVHGLMLCRSDEGYRAIHNRAALVVPDGTPLVWMARLLGHHKVGRVTGTDLMLALCERSLAHGWRHFLYGGGAEVADRLAAVLRERFPGIVITGSATPPFDPPTDVEDAEATRTIAVTAPDIVWVATGSPNQERWMAAHVERLAPAVLVGVGATFDFLAGTKKRAPRVLRDNGLEWLYRLVTEPRRLWHRYLLVTPLFVPLALLQLLGVRPPAIDDKAAPP